jgi:hypothetical protein
MIRLKIPPNDTEIKQISIYDSQGRIVAVRTSVEYNGSNAFNIETANLQAGVYFLRMSGDHIDYYTRFVVVR